jgi:hypothetical protein
VTPIRASTLSADIENRCSFANRSEKFHHQFVEGHIMKLPHRRHFFHLAAGAVALPAVSRVAMAQAFPTRPITMVVGFAAGGPTDVTARIVAERMRASLGQPIIIENVAGAAGSMWSRRPRHA